MNRFNAAVRALGMSFLCFLVLPFPFEYQKLWFGGFRLLEVTFQFLIPADFATKEEWDSSYHFAKYSYEYKFILICLTLGLLTLLVLKLVRKNLTLIAKL